MSVTIIQEKPDLYVITLSGVYTYDDQKTIEQTGGKIPESGKVNALIRAAQFTGWDNAGDWGDLTFMYKGDPYVNKIAVVVAEKWNDQMLMFFGEGRRNAQVRCFAVDEEALARSWLAGRI